MHRNCKILYYTDVLVRVNRLSEGSESGERVIRGKLVRDYEGLEVGFEVRRITEVVGES